MFLRIGYFYVVKKYLKPVNIDMSDATLAIIPNLRPFTRQTLWELISTPSGVANLRLESREAMRHVEDLDCY